MQSGIIQANYATPYNKKEERKKINNNSNSRSSNRSGSGRHVRPGPPSARDTC